MNMSTLSIWTAWYSLRARESVFIVPGEPKAEIKSFLFESKGGAYHCYPLQL